MKGKFEKLIFFVKEGKKIVLLKTNNSEVWNIFPKRIFKQFFHEYKFENKNRIETYMYIVLRKFSINVVSLPIFFRFKSYRHKNR